MPLFETYRNPEFRKQTTEIILQSWTDPKDFLKKYGPVTNPDAFAIRIAVCSYYDGIGVMVKRDLVDIGMVYDLIADSIIVMWEKIGPIFKNTRERVQNPYLYDDFEYLYDEIIKYRKEHPELKT